MKYLKFSAVAFLVVSSVSFFPSGGANKYVFLKGSLSGVVFNEAGQTIPQAGITVKGANYEDELKTDGQGRFHIRKLPTGVYDLVLNAADPGLSVRKEAAVHLGRETYVNLVEKSSAASDRADFIEPTTFRDSEGKVIHQETLVGNRAFALDCTYDAGGRVTAIRDSSGQEWNYEYTPSGKIRKVTRPDGMRIFYNYDADDELVKIDLPWGYKIYYEKKGNRFIKSVTKYKNQILYQFVYSIDATGNKISVEEGSRQKAVFDYVYEGSDHLKEIHNRLTGEANLDVVEYKGKVKNGAVDGVIAVKNGKQQDRRYEYAYDGRGNIVRQKELRGDMEVQRLFSNRDLLVREVYFQGSVPVFGIEYDYDTMDRLVGKTINGRYRYEYVRDPEGHVLQKNIRNLLTAETQSCLVYTPFHSEIDQDGFELVKYDKSEKLVIRDAEGNARYAVDIGDVMKHRITTLDRQVNMDGDYWGSPGSLMGLIESKMKDPIGRAGIYCTGFYDLPLADLDLSPVEFPNAKPTALSLSPSRSTWPGMSIGCYGYQMASPIKAMKAGGTAYWDCRTDWFDYCVDCYDGYIGNDLGDYECGGWVSGPDQLDPMLEGIYSLETDCYNPYGLDWFGQDAAVYNYGNWCTASWDTQSSGQCKELGLTYLTSKEYTFTDSNGIEFYYPNEVPKEAYISVFINYPAQPDVFSIGIYGYTTSGENNSFIQGDWIQVLGWAKRNDQDISNDIAWSVSGYGDSGGGIPREGTGASFKFNPNPNPTSSEGRGGPLSYEVTACLPAGGYIETSITITQDDLDLLRQEYIDFNAPWVPWRSDFDTYGPYHWRLLDPPDIDNYRHDPWHMIYWINIVAALTEFNFGAPIGFTSGYRCPCGNLLAGGSSGSSHIYGTAFDYVHPPQSAFVAIASAAKSGNLRVLLHVAGEPPSVYHEYNPPNQPAPAYIDRGHIEL